MQITENMRQIVYNLLTNRILFICISLLIICIFYILAIETPNRAKPIFTLRKTMKRVYKIEKFTNPSTKSIVDILSNVRNRNKGNDQFNKNSRPLLTLFTTWNVKEEKFLCRNNTVRNWSSLAPHVKAVLFSDNPDLRTRVQNKGWDVMIPRKSPIGVPILKYMYIDVMEKYNSTFYAYANGDILFVNDLVETLLFIAQSEINTNIPMLIVGQRTNVQDVTEEQASTFDEVIRTSKTGHLNFDWGEDYFITNSIYPWNECPEIVIGRVLYDNWLVLNARKRQYTTIDTTKTLLALHQTTRKGNDEGRGHPDSNYNGALLRKLYMNLHYRAGRTSCTTYCTSYKAFNKLQIRERVVPRNCFPL